MQSQCSAESFYANYFSGMSCAKAEKNKKYYYSSLNDGPGKIDDCALCLEYGPRPRIIVPLVQFNSY